MLGEKLFTKGDYDCDKEIRTLELLKLRFGEANLLNCEAIPLLLTHPLLGLHP
jgi:anaphase-promoting complex subunit 2